MGYMHAWAYKPDAAFQAAFEQLARDTREILPALADRQVPIANWAGYGDPEVTNLAISFNGAGPDADDTFLLEATGNGTIRHTPAGHSFHLDQCTTAGKPYDLAVTAVLLRAHQLTPRHIALASDGAWDEHWRAARALLASLFDADSDADPLNPHVALHGGPEILRTAPPCSEP